MRTNRFLFLLSLIVGIFLLIQCGGQITERPIAGCVKTHGMPGPEDMDLIRDSSTLLVSSHERRNGLKDLGAIFEISLKDPSNLVPKKIETNYPDNFRPHGISYAKIRGVDTLVAISHTLQDEYPHTLEIFERNKEGRWSHIKTLKDGLLISPNDIFMNEVGEIFVSNDNGTMNSFRKYWDIIVKSPRADVVYFNGKTFKNLNVPVILGNGIHIQKKDYSEILYRSVFSEGAIHRYKVIRENGDLFLSYLDKIEIHSGADNLIEDETGKIWVAGHPSTYGFLKHVISKSMESPTQVFVIDTVTNKANEVYANRGDEISAGSTGLVFRDKLFISQVFEDFILSCPRP